MQNMSRSRITGPESQIQTHRPRSTDSEAQVQNHLLKNELKMRANVHPPVNTECQTRKNCLLDGRNLRSDPKGGGGVQGI